MEIIEKIVEFDKYCDTCKHKECDDIKGQDPCHDCLNYPTNANSKRPIRYEADPKKIKKYK